MSQPAPATKPPLSTPLLVIFSLLLCGLIPALPIYLWQKGRLSKELGIGISVAMIVGFIGLGAYGAATEDKTEPKADPTKSSPSKKPAPAKKADAGPTAAQKKAALVAQAEKIAKAELPNTPYWKDATFEGTYRTSKKVCVDRTKKDGTNAGYVNVYFPKKTTGEPQDGTCAKPSPKPVDYEAKVNKAIRDKLGKSNRDVKRVDSVVYNGDVGVNVVVVRWAINENLTEGLTKKGAKLDVVEMLEVIQELQKDGMKVDAATFSGTYSLVDKLGNESEDKVVQARYSGSTIKKINFDNFLNKNAYEVADSFTLHPAFED